MAAYYSGPGSWLLSEQYKAAYNSILAAHSRFVLDVEIVSRAYAKSLEYMPDIDLREIDGLGEIGLCALAKAFAEADVYALAQRSDGSQVYLCWHRIKDIRRACSRITEKERANVVRWFRKSENILV